MLHKYVYINVLFCYSSKSLFKYVKTAILYNPNKYFIRQQVLVYLATEYWGINISLYSTCPMLFPYPQLLRMPWPDRNK